MVYMDPMGHGGKAQQSFEVARYSTAIIYCLKFQLPSTWNRSDKSLALKYLIKSLQVFLRTNDTY